MSTDFQVLTKQTRVITPKLIAKHLEENGWESVIYLDSSSLTTITPDNDKWERIEIYAWKFGGYDITQITNISNLHESTKVGSVVVFCENQEWDVEYDGLEELDECWINKILESKTTYDLNAASGSKEIDDEFFYEIWHIIGKITQGLLAEEMEEFDDKYWL